MNYPKNFILHIFFLCVGSGIGAQSITEKIAKEYSLFSADSQLINASSSLYVIDAKTGQLLFEKNSLMGLAPASTQKVMTSITAYELLGKDFTYTTRFDVLQKNFKGKSHNWIEITGSGDPTFGSWRWPSTKEDVIIGALINAISKLKITTISGININRQGWGINTIPDGWIWQDIGNYYGAGAAKVNWRENQFDVLLRSGKKIGDPVTITGYVPGNPSFSLRSELTSAPRESGDNAYIYFPFNTHGIITGTIPVDQGKFVISGAYPDPAKEFISVLAQSIRKRGIAYQPVTIPTSGNNQRISLFNQKSPTLDSIIYWLNKKSVNLYAEALIKTLGSLKKNLGSTDSGIAVVKEFWRNKEIDPRELNIYDGSGLSPLNRVTTHAQVEMLKYAFSQDWFSSFYHSLPEYNGMKLKSGTISDVKGYAGYYRSPSGQQYIISFLVNNYNGSTSSLVSKMYRVLDVLKGN